MARTANVRLKIVVEGGIRELPDPAEQGVGTQDSHSRILQFLAEYGLKSRQWLQQPQNYGTLMNLTRGPWMKPFAQNQNQMSARWLMFVTAVAVGFGAWFFDLVPQLRPVPSGQLSVQSDDEISLPSHWKEIDDRTDVSVESGSDEVDPLFEAIADDVDFQDQALTELSEPDISEEPSFGSDSQSESVSVVDPAVRQASFDSDLRSEGLELGDLPDSDVVRAVESGTKVSVLSAETADALRNVDLLVGQEKIVEAHNVLSSLYWKQPKIRSVLKDRIEFTAAEIFSEPHRHFGAPYLVEPGDTLESIGRKHNISWQYLGQLNRIEPMELQAGQQLKVMRGPFSAVVDLSRFELTVHAHGYFVQRYDVGTGEGDNTPLGKFTVQEKVENPAWYNPDGGQIDSDDPQNPLGEYWIGLGDHIGIHGTIDPQSIGSARSRGCIHMRDNDIAEVFSLLGQGASVRIRP
ncbi:MAG: L,D-transpeptidase family protein [Fuerstiella sp.]|nr:L,D-transpeptidase family protein [Fuerstiella sp.]